MFFLIILYVTHELFTLSCIWFFIIGISYTIHLLINYFLILDSKEMSIQNTKTPKSKYFENKTLFFLEIKKESLATSQGLLYGKK